MKIQEAIEILKTQIVIGRTPRSRPITQVARNTVDAVISDEKNYHNEAVQCLGCGYVTSILLTSNGCPNCGVVDMTTDIEQ